MKAWAELLDYLMIGTDGAAIEPEDPYRDCTPEQVLLKQIALAALYRRAGYTAQKVKTLPKIDPAPPETLPPCSAIAVDWLRRVVSLIHTQELALDWFLLIRARGKRVPHTELPYLLDLSSKHPEWAPYIMPIIGERGHWMVAQTDAYPNLRQPDLWPDGESLRASVIDPNNQLLMDLHKEMMEGLADE
jgi:hypothetical protein